VGGDLSVCPKEKKDQQQEKGDLSNNSRVQS